MTLPTLYSQWLTWLTLAKAQCPGGSAEDYELEVRTLSKREPQKESCKSLDQIQDLCRKDSKQWADFSGGESIPCLHFLEGTDYLKYLLEQCCLQTDSWYSNSSNRIGLQFVEEPSCDWEEPRGLWRAWLLGKRHTNRPFPCSRTAIVSVNLYKSDTFNLCPYLRTRKEMLV